MITTADKIVVMQAHESGSPIEALDLNNPNAKWEQVDEPDWDWYNFNYRIAQPKREVVTPTLGFCVAYGVISRNEFGGGLRASNNLYHGLEPGKRYYARLYEYDESRWSGESDV